MPRPRGQPREPGGHQGVAGGHQDEQTPEGGVEQGQAPAEGLLVEGEEEIEKAEPPVEHQGELTEQPGQGPEQRASAKGRQRQQHQGPGGEELPGVGAGLVGLAHQGEQGAEVEGQGQQQGLARGVTMGLRQSTRSMASNGSSSRARRERRPRACQLKATKKTRPAPRQRQPSQSSSLSNSHCQRAGPGAARTGPGRQAARPVAGGRA
jgi:hypothetical protein